LTAFIKEFYDDDDEQHLIVFSAVARTVPCLIWGWDTGLHGWTVTFGMWKVTNRLYKLEPSKKAVPRSLQHLLH